MTKPKDTSLPPPPAFRVIKIGDCSSLTGKSMLSYHVACDEKSDIYLRIASNSGGGYFNPDWVSLKAIQSAIATAPQPLTSFSLTPLFTGKSINTPSFLFAVLLAEGMVQRSPENPRVYVIDSPESFIKSMGSLIASKTALKVPDQISGKGAVKNKRKVFSVAEATALHPNGTAGVQKDASAANG